MQMKWAVEIQKSSLEKRNLKDLLNGLGFELVDGIDYLAFTSTEINNCATSMDVFEKAKKLRDAFTGPAQIDSSFTLGTVIDYSDDPPKRHGIAEVQTAVAIVTAGKVTVSISPPKNLSGDDLKKWEDEQAEIKYQAKLENQRSKLEPAYRDSKAVKILELLANENPTGEILYKIYELARGNKSNRDFCSEFGVTEQQFRRFEDAVHNPKATGDWARHAVERSSSTENPMSKKEAEQFVRQIAAEWLKQVRTLSAT